MNRADELHINDKTISYQMLYNIVGRRFHQCLHSESNIRPDLATQLSDFELVHSVCKKERLTFYNLLLERNDTQSE